MITPDEILDDVNQEIEGIKAEIIEDIDTFIKLRATQLKDLQVIQYEVDYQLELNADKSFLKRYKQFRSYIVQEIVSDYETVGWIVKSHIINGQTVLNFATEKIVKHRESLQKDWTL
jgi:hypothetical protein